MGANASNTSVTPSNLIKEDFHGFTVLIKECTELAEFGQGLIASCVASIISLGWFVFCFHF